MDLFSEPSNGQRVLTARHINLLKPLPEENNAYNATITSVCYSYSIQPDFFSYITVLQPYAWVIWSCGLAIILALWALYYITLRSALRYWEECRTSVALVVAVYPMVGTFALVATIVPRARILMEAFSQQIVMIALYHFYYVIVTECGGLNQLVARSEGSQIETRVLPCCCWPCCILPRPQVQKKSLSWLRYLILQIPIVQGILYFIILLLWAEDMKVYLDCSIHIQPFIAASILSGMWGIVMCVRVAEGTGAAPRRRLLALQLALVIVKLQTGIAKIISEAVTLPCVIAMHPAVFVNLIHNTVMILEMLLLSLWAWRLYRVAPGKSIHTLHKVAVAVLDDALSSAGKDRDIEKSISNKDEKTDVR